MGQIQPKGDLNGAKPTQKEPKRPKKSPKDTLTDPKRPKTDPKQPKRQKTTQDDQKGDINLPKTT